VIACKKDSLQVELARHKDLTSKLNSVLYLHVVCYYNASADSLATEALECKAGRVLLSADRKIELKTLNRISEVLYAGTNPADKDDNKAEVTVMTRSRTRRVHFEDQAELEVGEDRMPNPADINPPAEYETTNTRTPRRVED